MRCPRLALAHSMGFADWEAFSEALGAPAARGATLCRADRRRRRRDADVAGGGAVGAGCDERISRSSASRTRRRCASGSARCPVRESARTEPAGGGPRAPRPLHALLLRACAEADHPDLALGAPLPLVAAVARRSAYLLLLIENPPALADLVRLCGASPWIAEQLTSRPALLDELLDRASLYTAPEREALQDGAAPADFAPGPDDLEGHMEALRYFKASQVLRVAASELAGRLPLMKVSDKLSFIAEVCLTQVLALAWAQLVARYGEPRGRTTGNGLCDHCLRQARRYRAQLCLGPRSGIRLRCEPGGSTSGERAIDNATFYTRLAQRIIHILETRTSLGQLYEVDMRLRPSGASGLLVSSFEAFDRTSARMPGPGSTRRWSGRAPSAGDPR
jgi:glutamate-ammonia-ligase adenylyltransferase